MRGARFNFVRTFNMAPSPESFRRTLERIRPYGWYAKLFIGAEEFADHARRSAPSRRRFLIATWAARCPIIRRASSSSRWSSARTCGCC